MGERNPRYYGPGGWRAREAVLRIVRERAAAGEPCAICGRPIDTDAPQTFTDPMDGRRKRAPWSLECDEAIPVSLGGSPTDPANVRPVHRVCNQRRGARMDAPQGAHGAPAPPPLAHATGEGAAAARW